MKRKNLKEKLSKIREGSRNQQMQQLGNLSEDEEEILEEASGNEDDTGGSLNK